MMIKINALSMPLKVIGLCCLMILLIIAACKKDNQQKLQNAETISGIKAWFSSQTSNRTLTTSLFRQPNSNKISSLGLVSTKAVPGIVDHSLSIDWTNAKSYQSSDSTIIEVPVTTEGIFKFNTEAPVEGKKVNIKKSFTRLLFIKTSTATEGYFMTIISSDEYLASSSNPEQNTFLKKEPNFTGTIVYHNLDGKMTNAISIGGVKLPNKLASINHQSGSGKIMQALPDACIETPIYEVIGVDCYDIGGYYTYCENVYSLYVGHTICGGGSGPAAPGGGGTGGSGGESIPTIEVKQDSLLKHYPCMVKEVLNKLEGNQTYGKLVQPFQKIQLPNGTTLGMQGLPNLKYDFSVQDYGVGTTNYSLGTTGEYAGTSSTIRFNTAAMTNASQLLLQATAIHETGHAYANYYIKAGQYGFPVDTTRYSTWAINIVNFERVAKSSAQGGGNFNDHSIFLEEYFENFWGILKAVNGTAYTNKEYQMAALFGLNNPGPAPQSPIVNGVNVYEIYKGMLITSFNNIKTKYGITDAELNTFNLANLKNVPANKKLPTTCP
ncbi:hypothetical protein [Pedobacter kyonggii]|jgi:hypothetical protein|uniref:Uncharacterized protein n=1 Tax=Pedobacter kyonggii TaxID=1926871 RepID=A0A4Q9HDJ5_9SPHI|nr:hypothetical protein [Pedobacter kyonggii]TBO42636.1 hypothetical protein EYS08_09780 [Pedobacter kyonggii]